MSSVINAPAAPAAEGSAVPAAPAASKTPAGSAAPPRSTSPVSGNAATRPAPMAPMTPMPPMTPVAPVAPVVSVLIKALNEEKNIAVAIEHALEAVSRVGGEVILADSCSSDRTVEIAAGYPVRVVQLAHAGERCCGIGPQLGFQNSGGEFVYLLDGDMLLHPDFLLEAVSFMRDHPKAGAVGGLLVELNTGNLEYQARTDRDMKHLKPGLVDRLDGGGLYRREAITQIGYLSDRNLHSYEEFDLGIRIRHAGWDLWRIPAPAVGHHGHEISAYALLWRRWRSGYARGVGELVRAALGKPHAALLWRELDELKLYVMVMAYWLVVAALMPALDWSGRLVFLLAVTTLPLAGICLRKRSLRKGLYSFVSWHVNTAALIRGFMITPADPMQPVAGVVLSDKACFAQPLQSGDRS